MDDSPMPVLAAGRYATRLGTLWVSLLVTG
jgi:hypothetical protein